MRCVQGSQAGSLPCPVWKAPLQGGTVALMCGHMTFQSKDLDLKASVEIVP